MGGPPQGRAGEAFRRLLAEAASSPQARIDALIASSQRTVMVATWEPRNAGYRTLEHEDGHIGLPVFSDEWELEHAAAELGWAAETGKVGRKEIGMREAMRMVIEQQLAFLLIDLASTHCIEASRAEIEPLVKASSRSDSHGPFAAVGRITSSMMEAVRASSVGVGMDERRSRPPSNLNLPAVTATPGMPPAAARAPQMPGIRTPEPVIRPSQIPAMRAAQVPPSSRPPMGAGSSRPEMGRPSSAPALPRPAGVPAFSPSMAPPEPPAPRVSPSRPPPANAFLDHTATLAHVNFEPNEALLQEVSVVLKSFPEVEWASYCMVSISGGPLRAMIGVRVDPSMHSRIPDVAAAITATPTAQQTGTAVLVLDRLTREARIDGVPFHPWRRKRTGNF